MVERRYFYTIEAAIIVNLGLFIWFLWLFLASWYYPSLVDVRIGLVLLLLPAIIGAFVDIYLIDRRGIET